MEGMCNSLEICEGSLRRRSRGGAAVHSQYDASAET